MQRGGGIEEWVVSLKIALLEKDEKKAYELTQRVPLDSLGDLEGEELFENLEVAKELIGQAVELLESRRRETLSRLDSIRVARRYIF